jgi:DNA invertase Pin-like site-specific DNA recombinase
LPAKGDPALASKRSARRSRTISTAVGWQLVEEFVEVESRAKTGRPKLADTMAIARAHSAMLVIAKLDRLSRYTVPAWLAEGWRQVACA